MAASSPTAAPSWSSPTIAGPSIRLAALMQQRVIFVGTHDFDRARRGRADAPAGRAPGGPAGDPEPAGAAPGRRGRGAECWELALEHKDRPSVAGADPAGPPHAAHRAHARRTCAPAAPTCSRRRGPSGAPSPSSPPARRSPSRVAARALAGARRAWRRPWSRCRAGSCSSARTPPTAPACWARRRASPSRPPRPSAGPATSPARTDVVGMTQLRRQRPLPEGLRAFRHHGRGGGRAR